MGLAQFPARRCGPWGCWRAAGSTSRAFPGASWACSCRRIEVPSRGAAHQAIIAYLVANYRRYRNYDSMFGADFEHMRRRARYGLVPYELFRQTAASCFWKRLVAVPLLPTPWRRRRSTAGRRPEGSSSENSPTKVYSTEAHSPSCAGRWTSRR